MIGTASFRLGTKEIDRVLSTNHTLSFPVTAVRISSCEGIEFAPLGMLPKCGITMVGV